MEEVTPPRILTPAFARYNRPGRIVTLGHYYGQAQQPAAGNQVRETRGAYVTGADARVRDAWRWTRWINALQKDRKWVVARLAAQIGPMLEEGIALAVVPSHAAFHVFSPTRTLAQTLAAEGGRVDATDCLVRVETIRRIVWGGPSTRALHRATIRVERPELVQDRSVLLLDDIAKSGASLVACRELLLEAGASAVQAMALGRVVVPGEPPQLA